MWVYVERLRRPEGSEFPTVVRGGCVMPHANAGNWLQSSAREASPSPAPKFHSYPLPSLLSSFFDVLPHLDYSFSHKVPRASQKYWEAPNLGLPQDVRSFQFPTS